MLDNHADTDRYIYVYNLLRNTLDKRVNTYVVYIYCNGLTDLLMCLLKITPYLYDLHTNRTRIDRDGIQEMKILVLQTYMEKVRHKLLGEELLWTNMDL